MSFKLEEIFVTEGVPTVTFIKPPNFNKILVDVRTQGKPVILEGQSGTGKTTCIKRIIQQIDDDQKSVYLSGREQNDEIKIVDIVKNRPAGRFIIDDFHRLNDDIQIRLADLAKLAAENAGDYAKTKIIIIGINQVGAGLIQLVPDIAKRTGVHKIEPGSEEDIRTLVNNGCEKLNIKIKNMEMIYEETKGDYWLTQQICRTICMTNDVLKVQANHKVLHFNLDQLRRDVVQQLSASHYSAVKEFCRGRRFRPNNQPYFKLLRAIGQSGNSNVDLNELANANPDVRGNINNIKEHRLPVLIESKEIVADNFYYNKETKNFSVEDPALFYFIQHLDWAQLSKDCGFRESEALNNFEYEIALSFAGENRILAEYIANRLTDLDVAVFYDKNYEANFLGVALNKVFREIFNEKSKYVVCLLDKNHAEKVWPSFEREVFSKKIDEEKVIPVFLDDTNFPGISRDILGFNFVFNPQDENWKTQVDNQIIMKLIEKITSDY